MKISGFQKNSFVDYPGKMCAVVFTPGCNIDCFYCHNRSLVEGGYENLIAASEVLSFLESRKEFLDGVVVSGGEPTLQKGLLAFINDVKRLGYPVKLDTNGTSPEVIEKLIDERLIDYIAMDVKAPFEKYNEICRTEVDIDKIKRSIDLLINSSIDYEFRTTLAPGLYAEDIMELAGNIKGARLYVLQKCRYLSEDGIGSSADIVDCLVNETSKLVKRVETRGMPFCK